MNFDVDSDDERVEREGLDALAFRFLYVTFWCAVWTGAVAYWIWVGRALLSVFGG